MLNQLWYNLSCAICCIVLELLFIYGDVKSFISYIFYYSYFKCKTFINSKLDCARQIPIARQPENNLLLKLSRTIWFAYHSFDFITHYLHIYCNERRIIIRYIFVNGKDIFIHRDHNFANALYSIVWKIYSCHANKRKVASLCWLLGTGSDITGNATLF